MILPEKKLYVDDRNIPFKGTTIKPLETKSDIDAILAKWGIKKTGWEFDLDQNKVSVFFELPFEKFGNTQMSPVVRLEPPRIWNKRTRKGGESINWKISLRILHWFIKETLAMAYAMQSQKTVAFLPHIQTGETETLKDIILPRLSKFIALPETVTDAPAVITINE